MKLSKLLSQTGLTLPEDLSDPMDIDIRDLVIHSAKAGPQSLFICLKGARFDGHDFMKEVYDCGCRAFIAEHVAADFPDDACTVIVPSTRELLPALASTFYGHPESQMTFVGVTGTKGKTTVSWMLYRILIESGYRAGYIGTLGAYWKDRYVKTENTTPEPLTLFRILDEMRKDKIEYISMEVSSQALVMHRVDAIPFRIGIFTNLYKDHIGPTEHPDFNAYAEAKRSLFRDHKPEYAIINADNPYADFMMQGFTGTDVIPISRDPSGPVRLTHVVEHAPSDSLFITFDLEDQLSTTHFQCPMPGSFNAYNASQAAYCADILGIDEDDGAKILEHTEIPGRMNCIPFREDCRVIIDYAHNGASLKAALKTLRPLTRNRLIVLFGSVGERTKQRRQDMGEVASKYADTVILTSDNPGHEDPMNIIRDIRNSIRTDVRVIEEPDRAKAIRIGLSLLQSGDTLLLAGKGHENYQLIGDEQVPFSEKDIIKNYSKQ